MTRMDFLAGTSMAKAPCSSVVTPVLFPFTVTLTRAKGTSFSSLTMPVICTFSWASAIMQNSTGNKRNKILGRYFFIMAVLVIYFLKQSYQIGKAIYVLFLYEWTIFRL